MSADSITTIKTSPLQSAICSTVGPVQRKADPLAGQVLADGLRVSAPSDPLEREAEATADRVMRTPSPGRGAGAEVQRACASCSGGGNKERRVHRQAGPVRRAPAAIAGQGGPGSALPEGVRTDLEGRFGGQDFSGVRVHTGPQAAGLARSFNARAFTMGSDIYFGQGEYSPSSRGGQRLLAHELTHVVQGGEGRVQYEARHEMGAAHPSVAPPLLKSTQSHSVPHGVLLREEQSLNYRGEDGSTYTYSFTTQEGAITAVSPNNVAIIRNIHHLGLPRKVIERLRTELQRTLEQSDHAQVSRENSLLTDEGANATIGYSLARLLEIFRPNIDRLTAGILRDLGLLSENSRRLWGRYGRPTEWADRISKCIDDGARLDQCLASSVTPQGPSPSVLDNPAATPATDIPEIQNGESSASEESTEGAVRRVGEVAPCPESRPTDGGDSSGGTNDTWSLLLCINQAASDYHDLCLSPSRRSRRRTNQQRQPPNREKARMAAWQTLVNLRQRWDRTVNESSPNSHQAGAISGVTLPPIDDEAREDSRCNFARQIKRLCLSAIRGSSAMRRRQEEATRTLQQHGYWVRSSPLDQSGWDDRIGGQEAIDTVVGRLAGLRNAVNALRTAVMAPRVRESQNARETQLQNLVLCVINAVNNAVAGVNLTDQAIQRLKVPRNLQPLPQGSDWDNHARAILRSATSFLDTASRYRDSTRVNLAAVTVNLSLSGVEVTRGGGQARVDLWQMDPVFAVNFIRFLQALRGLGVVRVWTAGNLRNPLSPGDAHPDGNAFDINGFTMSSGDVIHLRHGRPVVANTRRDNVHGRGASDWFNDEDRVGSGDSAPTKAMVLLRITTLMSQFFELVVGPGGNVPHMNHWHVQYYGRSSGEASMNLVPAEQFYRDDGQGSSVRRNPRYARPSQP